MKKLLNFVDNIKTPLLIACGNYFMSGANIWWHVVLTAVTNVVYFFEQHEKLRKQTFLYSALEHRKKFMEDYSSDLFRPVNTQKNIPRILSIEIIPLASIILGFGIFGYRAFMLSQAGSVPDLTSTLDKLILFGTPGICWLTSIAVQLRMHVKINKLLETVTSNEALLSTENCEYIEGLDLKQDLHKDITGLIRLAAEQQGRKSGILVAFNKFISIVYSRESQLTDKIQDLENPKITGTDDDNKSAVYKVSSVKDKGKERDEEDGIVVERYDSRAASSSSRRAGGKTLTF